MRSRVLGVVALAVMASACVSNDKQQMEARLFEAVLGRDEAKARELLQAGVNPNARDELGRTPLMVAAGMGGEQVARRLLEWGADVHMLDSTMGGSALHFAAQGGSVEVARLLLESGAQINLQAPTHGITPLINAVWYRKPRMVEFLLDQPRINPNIRANFGATARDLVAAGAVANPSDPRPDPGLVEESREILALFDRYAAREAQKREGQKLFAAVVNAQRLNRQEQLALVRQLIAEGAPVNTVSSVDSSGNDGHTPLLVAARDGLVEVVRELLAAGADMRIVDEYMKATPAHKAAYMGHAEVLRELAKRPEFREIIDAQGPYNGYTALHDAAWHGHTEAARVLLEAGARREPRGHDGRTAHDLAREYGYTALAGLIGAP